MSFSASIKISELDRFPLPLSPLDFFPIVQSSSMTTYRIEADELMPSQHEFVTGSIYASSSIWASASVSASRSLYADNVAFRGYGGYVPIWWSGSTSATFTTNSLLNAEVPFTTNELTARGNLKYKSKLYIGPLSQSVGGEIVTIDPDYSLNSGDYLPVPSQTWYTASGGYKYQNSMLAGGIGNVGGGLNTRWPIISQDFVGTDRQYYAIATASYYDLTWQYTDKIWSGSLKDGSYKVFVPNTIGQISESFNKKWLRIACVSATSQYFVTTNAARGEIAGISGTSDLYGRIRIDLHTPNAGPGTNTNTWQVIDMNILNQVYTDSGKSVTVNAASVYVGPDIIKMIRLSEWPTPGNVGVDPFLALDIFIDGLSDDVDRIMIQLQSWNGLRFLKELNLDPPPLVNTGSSPYPPQSTYLTFPPEPGVYSNANYSNIGTQKFRNYNIQGMPVVIWPTLNERTGSVRDNSQFTSSVNASLNVSGTINATQRFACNDIPGVSGKFVAYDPSASMWQTVTYNGGILTEVSKSVGGIISGSTGSIIVVQSGGDSIPIGTIVAMSYPNSASVIPQNWLECDGSPITQSAPYNYLYNVIKTTNRTASFGWSCNSSGVYNATGQYFKLPDLRAEFIRGWDHNRSGASGGPRGLDPWTNRPFGSSQTSSFISHKHSLSPSTIPVVVQKSFIADPGVYGISTIQTITNTTYTTNNVGSSDTYPRNIAMVYIIKYSNAFNFSDLTGQTLAGDVQGSVSNTSVIKLQGVSIDTTVPTYGQVLAYSQSKWTPLNPDSIGGPGVARAWAMCACTSSTSYVGTHVPGTDYHYWAVLCGYNVRGITSPGTGMPAGAPTGGGTPPIAADNAAVSFIGGGSDRHWIVTLNTTMSSTNYAVFGSCGGQDSSTPGGTFVTMYPRASRTTTQFTLSMAPNATATFAGGLTNIDWMNFQVYENPLGIGNPTYLPF